MRVLSIAVLLALLPACGSGGGSASNNADASPVQNQPEPIAGSVVNERALQGKRLYLDGGRLVGTGVSCVDCHGDVVGSAFSLGKAANNPAAIDYAINAIPQMARARGRYSAQDLMDLATYIGEPNVASPDLRVISSGPAANPFTSARLEFGAVPIDTQSSTSTLRIVNQGRIAFQITAIPTLAGPDASQFKVLATNCQVGLNLVYQQACEIALAFTPTGQAGQRSAFIGIAHDWVRGAENVALLGEAVR